MQYTLDRLARVVHHQLPSRLAKTPENLHGEQKTGAHSPDVNTKLIYI